MINIRFHILSLTLLVAFSIGGLAQEVRFTGSSLSIDANVHGAEIFIDSLLVGTTPLREIPVEPGLRRVCAVASEPLIWYPASVCEEIEVSEGETRSIMLRVPTILHVMSEPYGARVFFNDSLVGETPFIFSTTPERGFITIVKEGFEPQSLPFDASSKIIRTLLKPHPARVEVPEVAFLDRNNSRKMLPAVLVGSSAVLSGVAAAHFKLRADNLYAEYTQTANSATLDRVKRLDVAAGVALGAAQVSLALLTYFLMSE